MGRKNNTSGSKTRRADIYQEVTRPNYCASGKRACVLVAKLGERLRQPAAAHPRQTISGINILLLWAQSLARGYANPT
ncbi:hypothetical protein [Sphingobium tyrosinilyticum]|uniref:Uncharacterized protein n=1 Tax=Sphingobium tyrosinilyticum TaxID=2715436 RepID=A0ABV9EXE8_9SPHN